VLHIRLSRTQNNVTRQDIAQHDWAERFIRNNVDNSFVGPPDRKGRREADFELAIGTSNTSRPQSAHYFHAYLRPRICKAGETRRTVTLENHVVSIVIAEAQLTLTLAWAGRRE
jgi:hypothetical protein